MGLALGAGIPGLAEDSRALRTFADWNDNNGVLDWFSRIEMQLRGAVSYVCSLGKCCFECDAGIKTSDSANISVSG